MELRCRMYLLLNARCDGLVYPTDPMRNGIFHAQLEAVSLSGNLLSNKVFHYDREYASGVYRNIVPFLTLILIPCSLMPIIPPCVSYNEPRQNMQVI